MIIDKETLRSKVFDILKGNGVRQEVGKIRVESPAMKGDQWASRVFWITVEFLRSDTKNLSMFVKTPVEDQTTAQRFQDVLYFESEVEFFKRILPEIKAFARESPRYDGFLEDIFPRCFFAGDDVLIFENVTDSGFKMLNRRIPHAQDSVTLVLKNLAKFHGSSLAYMQRVGEYNFESKYKHVFEKSIYAPEGSTLKGPFFDTVVNAAIIILSRNPCPGSEDALKFFRKYRNDKGFYRVCDTFLRTNQRCPSVIVHADVWNGNVMFREDPLTGKSAHNLIFDFQSIVLGSPALDLQRYILQSMDPVEIQTNWIPLLQLYLTHLQEILESLGGRLTFDLDALQADFRTKCLDGFWHSMFPVFAYDALEAVTHIGEVSIDNVRKTLERMMEERGEALSQNIVQSYQMFRDISQDVFMTD